MDNYSLGYVFTDAELQTLFSCLGIGSTYGLPIKLRSFTEEEEMQVIRSLVRKNVISPDDNDGYALDGRFREAFRTIKSGGGCVSLISKNFPLSGYICFAGETPVVWEIGAYTDRKFTMTTPDIDSFCRGLAEEGFIPYLSGYNEGFSAELGKRIEEAVSAAELTGEFSGMNFAFTAKAVKNGVVSYLISGGEISGNYLATVKNGVCTFEEHSREKLVSKLKSMLGGEF